MLRRLMNSINPHWSICPHLPPRSQIYLSFLVKLNSQIHPTSPLDNSHGLLAPSAHLSSAYFLISAPAFGLGLPDLTTTTTTSFRLLWTGP